MTLAEVYTAVRQILGVQTTSPTWSDANLLPLINMAQRSVWMKLAGLNPVFCTINDTFTYTAGAESVLLYVPPAAGLIDYPVLQIVGLFETSGSGAISASNHPLAILPSNVVDIEQYWADNVLYRTTPLAERRYMLAGNNTLAIRPIPASSLYCTIRYVPQLPDLAPGGGVFSGLVAPAHDLVVYRTCRLCAAKTRESDGHLLALEQDAWETLTLGMTPQSQMPEEPRVVYDDA